MAVGSGKLKKTLGARRQGPGPGPDAGSTASSARSVEELVDMIRAVEGERAPGSGAASFVATGWEPVDRLLVATPAAGRRRGLARGALHEWFGVDPAIGAPSGPRSGDAGEWVPPLGLLVHLVRQALRSLGGGGRHVVWIGRRLWPYPPALARALDAQSVFIDPRDDASRLWAIDLALRCPAFAAVVADASGSKMAHTRRLQLAATVGGTLGLMARPPQERHELSAAATRWWVSGVPAPGPAPPARGPRWLVTLVRCKGRQVLADHGGGLPRTWLMEQDRGQGVVRVHAEVVDRSDLAPESTELGTAAGERAGSAVLAGVA